jgi:hypothetical protein
VAASTDILIGDQGGQHVLIQPLARRHPGLFDYGDGNWITCELQIAAGGFRGSFRADLRSEEFQAFLEEAEGLSETLEGSAALSTMEGQIALSLTPDAADRIRVEGDAMDEAGSGNRLHFEFEIERMDLPPIRQSLEPLLRAYPVTGTADV